MSNALLDFSDLPAFDRITPQDVAPAVNVLLEREAVPEFLQGRLQPALLADAVERLLRDPAARNEQVAALGEFDRMLGEGTEAPSRRAARALLDFLDTELS